MNLTMALQSFFGIQYGLAKILYQLIVAGVSIATIVAILGWGLSLSVFIWNYVRRQVLIMTAMDAIAF